MTTGASCSTFRAGGELQLVSIVGFLKAVSRSRMPSRTELDRICQQRHCQSYRHPSSSQEQTLWCISLVSQGASLMSNVALCCRVRGASCGVMCASWPT
ncbi:hypothetical protein CGRA01v4_04574 [Colletotrichum graminicola]|nr:hypothetical protein CGRA01v4_04574 [Colletotrichum graminicola]